MAEAFDAAWLALRERFDAAARAPALAEALMAHLAPRTRPRFLDLGAGTGSLTRWLGHFVGRAHGWVLADADPDLLAEAFAAMEEGAAALGWAATAPQRRALLIHAPRGAWRIEAVRTDLARAPEGLPLAEVDAVTCSALCDLVSAGWIERLAAALAARRLPFYSALNVTGRERFAPPAPGDALVARGFARDQRRGKGFGGPALGPGAPEAIARAFAARGYRVLRARSDWVVPRGEAAMLRALVQGHAEAARRQERRAARRILAWQLARLAQIAAGRLSIRVPHEDVLCLPPA